MTVRLKVDFVSVIPNPKKDLIEADYEKELLDQCGGMVGALFYYADWYRGHQQPGSLWGKFNNHARYAVIIKHFTSPSEASEARFVVNPVMEGVKNERA